jgi:hypothetical protein
MRNVGPCLAICNGGGKDGFPPLDVTSTPCLDVTPLCHIKEGFASARTRPCVCADAAMRQLGDGRVHADALMTAELYLKK